MLVFVVIAVSRLQKFINEDRYYARVKEREERLKHVKKK